MRVGAFSMLMPDVHLFFGSLTNGVSFSGRGR